MMRPVVGATLRWIAIAIAILAAVDPVFTISRGGHPLVAVVASNGFTDSAAINRVIASLRSEAKIVSGPFGGADATVIVGQSLPDAAMESATPVFAVTPSGVSAPTIEAVSAPRTVALDGAITVLSTIRVPAGEVMDAALFAGDVELDRKTIPASNAAARNTVTLTAAPSDTGVQQLRLVASIGSGPAASADLLVDVRPRRWAILAYDARPSWSSRFVRIALERDPRFDVAGRVLTSRAFSSDAGTAPARLDDAAALRDFDAVIVGAPGALTEAAVKGLEQYMRTRGGSVILLMDDAPVAGNGALARLIGSSAWRTRGDVEAYRVSASAWQGRKLRASQVAAPVALPPGASVVALARMVANVEPGTARRAASDTTPAIAVWDRPVGAGRLVVSGALDAWRYRDSTWSNYDRVWQDLVAEAAARAPEPVSVSMPASVAPGGVISVVVSIRDVALRGTDAPAARASVSAAIVSPNGTRTPVRLWPGRSIGEFSAAIGAPMTTGTYRLEVSAANERGSAPFVVRPDPASAIGYGRAALAPWVEGNGGRVFAEADIGRLPDAIRGAISFSPRAEPWHPMRSPWWILPFALLLSAEWYARRRRGLA